jgi:hypothetical protein
MIRGRKSETVRLRNERDLPHLVELALPDERLLRCCPRNWGVETSQVGAPSAHKIGGRQRGRPPLRSRRAPCHLSKRQDTAALRDFNPADDAVASTTEASPRPRVHARPLRPESDR